ncbi:Saccharopine dehydrogenase [Delitschia confertaspora ATCC 74209]|uniref:Saccharopine dehydrogenase n=1 Tax=Delitschia confertaspora ATCC 74209 TaxID=1513339 RepID=A0A9P4JP87_9PLEO|nr:Saccharopine dehydrogenase [Delitschia confertaspora ATCC 74209]
MIAPPCIEYLSSNPNNHITIVDYPNSTCAITLDVSDSTALDKQIAAHDLVISLIPYTYHPAVIQSALKSSTPRRHSINISPPIRVLFSVIKKAGITVLSKVGVDPRVGHFCVVKKIDEVRKFYPYCGGLPTPGNAGNPLGFKFSWSPHGTLLSQRNSARFLKDGVVVEIPSEQWMGSAGPYYVKNGYDFLTGHRSTFIPAIKSLLDFPNEAESQRIISGLQWMGILSSEKAKIVGGNLLATLCGESDLVRLEHKFVVEWDDGKTETFTSTLELLGDPDGYSTMSKAVVVTSGLATQLLLDGHPALSRLGVWAPYEKEICDLIRGVKGDEGVLRNFQQVQ